MNLLQDILTFAWRKSGKYMLLSCVFLTLLIDIVNLSFIFSFSATLLISAYCCATYYQLILSSSTGGQEAPNFPDVSSFLDDLVFPAFEVVLAIIISFGPFIGYLIWLSDPDSIPIVAYLLLGFGIIYFPMAMLAVVVLGYTTAMSPHIVIPAILRGGWVYWLGVVMLVTLYVMSSIIRNILPDLVIISHVIMAFVGSYTFMTNARILGIVYRERQEKLGWLHA